MLFSQYRGLIDDQERAVIDRLQNRMKNVSDSTVASELLIAVDGIRSVFTCLRDNLPYLEESVLQAAGKTRGKIPRLVAFDADGKCVAVGNAAQVAWEQRRAVATEVFHLPGTNPEFIDVNVVGWTREQIDHLSRSSFSS